MGRKHGCEWRRNGREFSMTARGKNFYEDEEEYPRRRGGE